ncbi:hemolysin family protein [Thiobaca trueperi]|uniref:CBS domain containing-hemolysin-like protein n=1 Tax=Thiobaca trueperi TaxID=127458 RepID=A0A4R3MXD3_9GAMM|nr:hemolysin family protein [Thiobaca trueperi]TCT20191.1 CBS domain containing-hemolysin-like protein [Thiobaca trueperi]
MLDLLIVLLVIMTLVALNGLFVAAEFAIIGSSRAALAARAETGDLRARRIAAILDDPARLDRYVATAQLGITVASLGLGMYGEHRLAVFFAQWLIDAGFAGLGVQLTAHGLASVLAITVITYLHIVFGEMIPKALALSHAMRVALWVTPPMLLIGLLLYPLVRGLNLIGNFLLHLVGVERGRSAGHYLDPNELESLARESQEGGLLSEESGRIFQELADFSEISAVQAMVPRVRTHGIPSDANDTLLREILLRHRHTRYPVYTGDLDQIVGTVHIKDLIGLLRAGSGLAPEAVHETAYLPETATLDDVLAAMDRVRNQMIVVMDEHGGTAGILTIEDICAEAVGDMEEGADDVPDVLPVGLDRYQVQGTVRLDTLGVIIGTELEHPEVDSVSGLILSELGRPPLIGDHIHWHGLSFEVSSLYGRGVRQVIVTREPSEPVQSDDVAPA